MRRGLRGLLPLLVGVAGIAHADSVALPLAVTDASGVDGTVTVETSDWKLVFSEGFNWGPHQLFDLGADPGQTDNLATDSFFGDYSQGVLYRYDVYLGTTAANAQEFQTTLGRNASPGTATLEVLENTAARVRLRQFGHPRLNNGTGPPGDPFPELELVDATTLWTVYPTGKVHVDIQTALNPAGTIVDSGPGGAGKGIDAPGCCGNERILNASGGADFLVPFVWAGDTIESSAGAWGPILIIARLSPTQLELQDPVPPGADLDYVIRRSNILMETQSLSNDGDPTIVNQCSDPAVSRWEGGSNGDPLWSDPDPGPCMGKFRCTAACPPVSEDFVLAMWARDRAWGGLLTFFESWPGVNFGVFNDLGFTDISFTQLGKFGTRAFEPFHRHYLSHMGSTASEVLPDIENVSDALPIALDYRAPYAEALVGSLGTGPEISAFGFDPGTGSYEIRANLNQAVIRFDASGGSRTGFAYHTPAVVVSDFFVSDPNVVVEISTNAGNSFLPIDASLYNLSSAADESELGVGRRAFQYLGEIPSTASGSNAVAFRFADQASPTPVPILPEHTIPLLITLLLVAGLASLSAWPKPHRVRKFLSNRRGQMSLRRS